jgi:ATP-dependent Clp protease adaptor protein ClpS
MTSAAPQGSTGLLERTDEATASDTPWQVLLHNDPVNLPGYVTGVLVKVLEVSKDKAETLMLTAHTTGKAAVSDGTLAECEGLAAALMAHTLWASIEKAGR